MKYTKLCIIVVTLSANKNQKLPKRLSKRFERSEYWNKYKSKRNKNRANKYRYFSEANFVGVHPILNGGRGGNYPSPPLPLPPAPRKKFFF